MSLSTRPPDDGGKRAEKRAKGLSVRELVIFGMLGSIMFCSKLVMEWAPNIHFIGAFTMVFTIVYRVKGLIPLYVFVMLEGLFSGFSLWWLPYLYIWTVLWGVTMLLPKELPLYMTWVYPLICGLHGLSFGTLYAPAQALMFGLSFRQTLAWIAAGFPFDVMHAIGNLAAGMLIMPLAALLRRLDRAI